MNKRKWTFKGEKGGIIEGLTTGDKVIFTSNAFKTFTREILQNSIDVRYDDSEPVSVELKTFKLKTKDFFDVDELRAQIQRCIKYWKGTEEVESEYKKMLDILNNEYIDCLRISDKNTTGLLGMYSDRVENNNYISLVRGSGVSEKNKKTSGGSKGVGKNAAFVLSNLDTVCYASKNINGEVGTIGTSHLISGLAEGHEDDFSYVTHGKGFYTDNENNYPIKEIINLDKSYVRCDTGTDVFIIGFRQEKGWLEDIITSLFDSFFLAFYYNDLEVRIEDHLINNNNFESYIDSEYINDDKVSLNCHAALDILNDKYNNLSITDITSDYADGIAQLYLITYPKQEKEKANHMCQMIRYPYMKINDQFKYGFYDFSALFIINDCQMAKKLRDMENSKHNKWDPTTIKDVNKRPGYRALLNDIKKQIEDAIESTFKNNVGDDLDPNGANEFLPSYESGDLEFPGMNNSEIQKDDNHNITLGKLKKNKIFDEKSNENNPNGNSVEPSIGNVVEDDEIHDGILPFEENEGEGGSIVPHQNTGKIIEGNNVILKNIDMSPIKYKFIGINIDEGVYKVVFLSPIDCDECYFNIKLVDEANNKTDIKIENFECDGNKILFKNDINVGPFKIHKLKKCIIKFKTKSITGNIGSLVRVICK